MLGDLDTIPPGERATHVVGSFTGKLESVIVLSHCSEVHTCCPIKEAYIIYPTFFFDEQRGLKQGDDQWKLVRERPPVLVPPELDLVS